MQNAIYAGVNAAVLTPMTADLAVDLDRMAAHCRWLLGNGCDGLGILGTTGEANSLGISERLAFMEGLVERGVPAETLLPGVGTPAITDTVLLARRAAELGCPGVLALPPFFYKNPSEDGLFAFFSEVVQRTGGTPRLYLYHFPAQSAVPITLSLVERLLRAFPGTVRGIKDSSADLANTRAYVDHFAQDGFEVYCADDGHLLQHLAAGGAGCITAASNVTSAVNARVYAGRGSAVGADAQAVLTALRRALTSQALIPGLKALVARHTGDAAWRHVRPPHMPLSAEAEARLLAAFDACGTPMAARAA